MLDEGFTVTHGRVDAAFGRFVLATVVRPGAALLQCSPQSLAIILTVAWLLASLSAISGTGVLQPIPSGQHVLVGAAAALVSCFAALVIRGARRIAHALSTAPDPQTIPASAHTLLRRWAYNRVFLVLTSAVSWPLAALVTHTTPASVTVVTLAALGGALISMYALTTVSRIPPRRQRAPRRALVPVPICSD